MSEEPNPVDPVEGEEVEVGEGKIRQVTDYEKRLRRENAKHRTDLKSLRDEFDAFKLTKTKELDETRAAERKSADQRIIAARLETAAIKHGFVDLDALKLLDTSTIVLNDAGQIDGADALFEDAKKSKPYLFKTSTSNPNNPPNPNPPAAKNARDMTQEEYAAERAKIARGR